MNLQKAELKIALARDLAAQYASMAKGAENDQFRQEGARDALKLAAERVGELGANVVLDLDQGVLSAADLKDPDKVLAFIKRYIKRAVGVIDNLATTAEVARMIASGRQTGLKNAEAVAANMLKAEVAKIEELQRQIDAGELTAENFRAGHPGTSLKQQRQEEAEAPAPPVAAVEPPVEPSVQAPSEPPASEPASTSAVSEAPSETSSVSSAEEPPSPEAPKTPRRPRKKPVPRAR